MLRKGKCLVYASARGKPSSSIPGVCSISLTAGELGPAIMKTVSTVPARRAWTASVPVDGSSFAVASVMPLAASSVRATARVPLPSGPIASRRPLSSRRSVGPGAVREKTHSGSKYRLASDTRVSVFATEAGPALHEGDLDPALGVLEQPDVLDRARGLPDLERDAGLGEVARGTAARTDSRRRRSGRWR